MWLKTFIQPIGAEILMLSYAREDDFCPQPDLLKEFMDKDSIMSFGEYAQRYAKYLQTNGILPLAMASVVFNLARKQLPIFYCIDPYIPNFADPTQFCSQMPYEQRTWLDKQYSWFRTEGCHRVVLVEEIIKGFFKSGINTVELVEFDQTFEAIRYRSIKKGD
ncbi:hypothetical protein TI05_16955 [Achromatium sp. WMS3]|nr:hypothetical protein TI05_16955 [Achromatium sp. WMS3]